MTRKEEVSLFPQFFLLRTNFYKMILLLMVKWMVEINNKGRHPKKKTADLVKTALLGGRGSEKLLNFHHLQMMKNMEGGGLRVTFHYFIEQNYD